MGCIVYETSRRTIDLDELERAAGYFEIMADGEPDALARSQIYGAAMVMRVMGARLGTDHETLYRDFRRLAFGEAGTNRKEQR